MLVSWGETAAEVKDWMSNTLYFSVDIADPAYDDLAAAVLAAYVGAGWTTGQKIEVRAYNMADAKPRPERAYKTQTKAGIIPDGPHQVALCLSYYSERNLPRRRGRIYIGPWSGPTTRPSTTAMASLITFGQALANVGGANVDWSVWSTMDASEGKDASHSISNIWVDNSWDVQRRRQLEGTARQTAVINE